jgi:hypothetical protein
VVVAYLRVVKDTNWPRKPWVVGLRPKIESVASQLQEVIIWLKTSKWRVSGCLWDYSSRVVRITSSEAWTIERNFFSRRLVWFVCLAVGSKSQFCHTNVRGGGVHRHHKRKQNNTMQNKIVFKQSAICLKKLLAVTVKELHTAHKRKHKNKAGQKWFGLKWLVFLYKNNCSGTRVKKKQQDTLCTT